MASHVFWHTKSVSEYVGVEHLILTVVDSDPERAVKPTMSNRCGLDILLLAFSVGSEHPPLVQSGSSV